MVRKPFLLLYCKHSSGMHKQPSTTSENHIWLTKAAFWLDEEAFQFVVKPRYEHVQKNVLGGSVNFFWCAPYVKLVCNAPPFSPTDPYFLTCYALIVIHYKSHKQTQTTVIIAHLVTETKFYNEVTRNSQHFTSWSLFFIYITYHIPTEGRATIFEWAYWRQPLTWGRAWCLHTASSRTRTEKGSVTELL